MGVWTMRDLINATVKVLGKSDKFLHLAYFAGVATTASHWYAYCALGLFCAGCVHLADGE